MQIKTDPVLLGTIGTLITVIVTAVIALIKLKPDTNRVVVSAAEGAVVVQTSVITNLTKEIERLADDHTNCEKEMAEQKLEYQGEIAALRKNYMEEIEQLRKIVKAIDDRKRPRREEDTPK